MVKQPLSADGLFAAMLCRDADEELPGQDGQERDAAEYEHVDHRDLRMAGARHDVVIWIPFWRRWPPPLPASARRSGFRTFRSSPRGTRTRKSGPTPSTSGA